MRGTDQIARSIKDHGWGSFEPPLPDVFAIAVRRSRGRVIDVGANTGFYALLAARSSRHVRIDAFEPFPPVQAILRENVLLNSVAGRVTVLPYAVSDVEGEANLYVPTDEHGQVETSASLNPEFKERVSAAIAVGMTTLDHYTAGFDRVDVVKIDVESLEHKVLLGARTVLGRLRPIVFFELLPHKSDAPAIEAIRAEHGYSAARLLPTEVVMSTRVAPDTSTWNHVLIPPEKQAAFERTVAAAGFPIHRES